MVRVERAARGRGRGGEGSWQRTRGTKNKQKEKPHVHVHDRLGSLLQRQLAAPTFGDRVLLQLGSEVLENRIAIGHGRHSSPSSPSDTNATSSRHRRNTRRVHILFFSVAGSSGSGGSGDNSGPSNTSKSVGTDLFRCSRLYFFSPTSHKRRGGRSSSNEGTAGSGGACRRRCRGVENQVDWERWRARGIRMCCGMRGVAWRACACE